MAVSRSGEMGGGGGHLYLYGPGNIEGTRWEGVLRRRYEVPLEGVRRAAEGGEQHGAWRYWGDSQPCRDLYRAALGLAPGRFGVGKLILIRTKGTTTPSSTSRECDEQLVLVLALVLLRSTMPGLLLVLDLKVMMHI